MPAEPRTAQLEAAASALRKGYLLGEAERLAVADLLDAINRQWRRFYVAAGPGGIWANAEALSAAILGGDQDEH